MSRSKTSKTSPGRAAAWATVSPDKRRAILRPAHEARSRNARERRIALLIEQAPPLTSDQVARLTTLLSGRAVA